MSFLGSLHEGRTAAQLDVRPGGDQEVGNIQESPTAGQGQGCLLCLLCLGVDVSILETETWSLNISSVTVVYELKMIMKLVRSGNLAQ